MKGTPYLGRSRLIFNNYSTGLTWSTELTRFPESGAMDFSHPAVTWLCGHPSWPLCIGMLTSVMHTVSVQISCGLRTKLDLVWNKVSELSFLLFAFQNQWQLGILLLGEGEPLLCSTYVIVLVNLKGYNRGVCVCFDRKSLQGQRYSLTCSKSWQNQPK